MDEEQELKIPPELQYITQACRAVSSKQYEHALNLVREGLRRNSGIADQIDTAIFIALLRTLVVDIELGWREQRK